MLADIHTHLHHFGADEIKEIIEHPDVPDVIISSVWNKKELEYSLDLKKSYGKILISAGVHPQIADISDKECLDFSENLGKIAPQLTAIGEIGYDLYETNPPQKSQLHFFEQAIQTAENYNLPVIIHCRNAFEELLPGLSKISVPVILHGYSGGFKYLNDVIKKNYYISFGTPLTYEQSRNLRRIAALLPLPQILTETDSPFNLRRHANWQAEKNKPYNLKKVVQTVAEVKMMPLEETEEIIFQNYTKIFCRS